MILRILLQLKLEASVAATFSHRQAISFCHRVSMRNPLAVLVPLLTDFGNSPSEKDWYVAQSH